MPDGLDCEALGQRSQHGRGCGTSKVRQKGRRQLALSCHADVPPSLRLVMSKLLPSLSRAYLLGCRMLTCESAFDEGKVKANGRHLHSLTHGMGTIGYDDFWFTSPVQYMTGF